jgi:hypothetical protein
MCSSVIRAAFFLPALIAALSVSVCDADNFTFLIFKVSTITELTYPVDTKIPHTDSSLAINLNELFRNPNSLYALKALERISDALLF